MASEDLHIPREALSTEARLLHYAIASLREELDAVDWYRQRADAGRRAETDATTPAGTPTSVARGVES